MPCLYVFINIQVSSMPNKFVLYNSTIYLESQVPLDYFNRAFSFGDAILETVRGNAHFPLYFHLHYKRIVKAMISLKMDVASFPREQKLHDLITKLLQKNMFFKSSRISILVFRRGKALLMPESKKVDFLIEVNSIHDTTPVWNEKGIFIGVYKEMQKAYGPISSFNTANGLHATLASIYAKESGVQDCLLINNKGLIIESASSNVFYIKGNVVYTPSVFTGCVDGVMRQVVIDLINRYEELTLVESQGVSIDSLMDADEIFLTNVINGIQWVVGFENKRFFYRKTKLLNDMLNDI